MKFPSFTVLVTVLGLVVAVGEPTPVTAAAPKPAAVTPRHDPPDMPFRAAPTPAATRSIAIAVSTNLHVGFDTDLCRIHTVWRGRGLNLYGPQYSFSKSPFISTFNGEVLWTMPPVFPWAVGSIPAADLPEKFWPVMNVFWGLQPKANTPEVLYAIGNELAHVVVGESFRPEQVGTLDGLVRRFRTVLPTVPQYFFLAHAEEGEASPVAGHPEAVVIKRRTDALLVVVRGSAKWRIDSRDANYTVERTSETGAEKGNARQVIKRRETRLWLELAPRLNDAFEIVTAVAMSEARAIEALKSGFEFKLYPSNFASLNSRPPKAKVFSPAATARPSVAGNEHYRVENFPVPKETELLVTGMDFFGDGNLAIATWLGDIFIVDGATGPVNQARYRRVARGLLEPMGLLAIDRRVHVAQKGELTAVRLAVDDSEVVQLSCSSADWDYSGHYNAFVYGPALLKDGSLVVANAGHAGRWNLKHMGWVLRTGSAAPPSKMVPIASGLREPNGVGTFGPDRDLFVTDNQGNWIAACKLNHIQQGRFYGHPSSKPAPESEYGKTTKFDPPAVWFPYKLVRSASGFVEIPDDRFGPFKGQLLVGDFQNALVTRVFLEKVNGEYQGAVWPMLKGFLSGVNRLAFGPDGNLYVGGCQRTWAAVAPLEAALERVSFTGKVPFEIREARARVDGFELVFTQPVDPATAGNVESYDVGQYNYRYSAKYGSPEFDHEGRENRSTAITVTKAEVSADRLSVSLRLQGWKTGYVTSVRGTDVKSATGAALWNPTFYYTLNQIPK